MLSRHVSLPSSSFSSSRLVNARNEILKCARPRAKSRTAVSPRCYHIQSPKRPYTIDLASRNLSDIGLRTQLPPDSLPDPNQSPPEIPDQDWEIRTGRAIYVLQETLPEFFKTGLITSINKITGTPRPPNSTSTPSANPNFLEHDVFQDEEEAIYSPNIRLSYTPPVALPPPFPKTLHAEGIQLYLASSSLIRHTMLALYSDLAVRNDKLVVNTPSTRSPSSDPPSRKKRRISREKSVLLRQTVTGIARVSGKPGEWVIESTYTFSPITGLIHQHVVNSIHPAPHQAVYDSLRLSLGKLLGFEWGSGPGRPSTTNGAAFNGEVESRKGGQ
ncbi:hypothetical protein GALMADRAFT_76538 [Galerina marginata CBS 339.88]|uniref:Uncharacterized protein n=1 Tax=Galerina marginata (strain CBS 339.88) TaxID=685588 RepID=A0A067SJD6_GALM3|nr:hypothetical protein GALMADRAFT_76538 [Galerina marginata CBS 339.88]